MDFDAELHKARRRDAAARASLHDDARSADASHGKLQQALGGFRQETLLPAVETLLAGGIEPLTMVRSADDRRGRARLRTTDNSGWMLHHHLVLSTKRELLADGSTLTCPASKPKPIHDWKGNVVGDLPTWTALRAARVSPGQTVIRPGSPVSDRHPALTFAAAGAGDDPSAWCDPQMPELCWIFYHHPNESKQREPLRSLVLRSVAAHLNRRYEPTHENHPEPR